jgi:hypothetical protein
MKRQIIGNIKAKVAKVAAHIANRMYCQVCQFTKLTFAGAIEGGRSSWKTKSLQRMVAILNDTIGF